MTRKQRAVKPEVSQEESNAATAEQKQPEVMFAVKIEVIGAEPVEVNGLNGEMAGRLHQWFSGVGHWGLDLPIGNGVLSLDRNKVGYIFISPQGETDGQN